MKKYMLHKFITPVVFLKIVLICLVITTAQATETFILSHFLGQKSLEHSKFLAPWSEKIEKESKGRIKFEIFPSMTLGGKPPELYRQVRDGAADIVWTLIGYTPGVFPRSEVFELPSVHKNSARATNLAIQEHFDLIAKDYKDIKPLLVHVHAGNAIHLVKKCVTSVKMFKGLKIRTPSRTGGWMINAWNAEPVGMPVPDLPQALSKGVVDGALIPFEIVPPLKVHELTKCSVTGYNDTRFGTSVFLFAMNKERYNKLPSDLKAIIDANSGKAIAEQAGDFWDAIEQPGKDLQKETNSPIIILSKQVTAELANINKVVEQRWIQEVSKYNINAPELVEKARNAVKKYSQ